MANTTLLTWATSVPILVFPGLSVLDLGPMYATDVRQTDKRQTRIIAYCPALWRREQNKLAVNIVNSSLSLRLTAIFQVNLG